MFLTIDHILHNHIIDHITILTKTFHGLIFADRENTNFFEAIFRGFAKKSEI